MKKLLLYSLTIITYILIIISKETNAFLSFFLLIIPLLINNYLTKDSSTLLKYNKIFLIFYLTITIIYYFITYNPSSTLILLFQMLLHYFYTPNLAPQKDLLYTDKIIVKKTVIIPPQLRKDFSRAGIIIENNNNEKKVVNSAKELSDLYNAIKQIRINYENQVRTLKMHIISSFIIPSIIIFIFITKLPNPLDISNVQLLYFLLYLTNSFLFCYLPSEKDIMLRRPRQKDSPLFSKEEKLFMGINIFCFMTAITIPYMYSLFISMNEYLSKYLFIISIVIVNIINIAYNLNDSLTIVNLIKSVINKIFLAIIATSTIIIILIHYLYNQYNIYKLSNIPQLIIILFLIISWEDIIKIARYLKLRKKEKNDRNNQ